MRPIYQILLAALFAACTTTTASPTPTPAASLVEATPVAVTGGTFWRLSPEALHAKLTDKNFFLVNTHIPYEGELEQTDAFIPFDTITQHLDQLPADKNAPIVLYCRSGRMSTMAAEALVKAGYTNIWELAGGMLAWEKAGLTVVHK